MRITTYATRINEAGLTILVKEKTMNYAQYESLDSPGKVANKEL